MCLIHKCHAEQLPIAYLQRSFSHPMTLLSAMFDTGCVLSGSRALEFFVSGSTGPNSDWDFYVPGYTESVNDMISALGRCGVKWHLEADNITTGLLHSGEAIVTLRTLQCLSSWVHGITNEAASRLLGKEVYEMVQIFQSIRKNGSPSKTYQATINSQRVVHLKPLYIESRNEDDWCYDDPSGGSFSIIRGHVETPRGSESIQLIIGTYASGIRGCLSFIKSFYASHVQCFVGGWCAAHMHFQQSLRKQAKLWELESGQSPEKVALAVQKYEKRGYAFHRADSVGELRVRTFGDSNSCFIDYGSLYRECIPATKHDLLSSWLDERRKNIHSISWVENRRGLSVFSPMYACEERFQPYSSETATVIRLADLVSSYNCCDSLCALRSRDNISTLSLSFQEKERVCDTAARSGTVWSSLHEGNSWSWVM